MENSISSSIIEKIVFGLIKFYLTYFLFSIFATVIIYASADVRIFIETKESFFFSLFTNPNNFTDEDVMNGILKIFKTVFDSVPGDTFFDTVLGISFDSNVSSDLISSIIDLVKHEDTFFDLKDKLKDYTLFWRDMAVTTSASMVLYAVSHFKSKISKKSISVWLGFALASILWIFAGYTFAETVTFALERRVAMSNLNYLYIIIIVTAILLEALIHSYGGNCSVFRLIVLLFFKIIFNLFKSFFVLYICRTLVNLFNISESSNVSIIPLNIISVLISAGIVICIILAESIITKWSEKVIKAK